MFTHVALRSSWKLVELCPCFPDRIGIWKCCFFWKRTNNKLNPHMMSTPGPKPAPHWWEVSALTTTPTLRSFICHRTGLEHQYGRRFIVWDTKMAEAWNQRSKHKQTNNRKKAWRRYWKICYLKLHVPLSSIFESL